MKPPSDTSSGLSANDYRQLKRVLLVARPEELLTKLVDAPFSLKVAMAWLFLGFICVYIVEGDSVQLKAATGSEYYKLAVEHYKFQPQEYRLDLDKDSSNTIVKAILSGKPETTADWVTVSRLGVEPEVVRLNQANSGIAYTVIYPFSGKVSGALMYNFYQYPASLGKAQWAFMKRYTALASSLLNPQNV